MNTDRAKSADFFISRADADKAFADWIGRELEDKAGYKVFLQQWDMRDRNFIERIHTALASGARVIALLSNEYLASDACTAEWASAIAHDPLNHKGRLIVLRVAECTPIGLLSGLAYWDLLPIRSNPDLVREVVLTAIKPGRHKGEGLPGAQYWREPRAILHDKIRNRPAGFTGRRGELHEIDGALSHGAMAAVTQPATVHGLGGIGKSTLAREYGWEAREGYAGVWWLDAEKSKESGKWDGVEKNLVELRNTLYPGLPEPQDARKAARDALELIAHGGFEKPWLLIYDNVDDTGVLGEWTPFGNAHVLMTTRLSAFSSDVPTVEVREWPLPDAVKYLLAQSGRGDLTEADAVKIAAELGRLPLALSHAAAYLKRRRTVTADAYLEGLTRFMNEVPPGADYDKAVFATFMQAAEQAEREAPGARAVLSLSAFYAPDSIPEELFRQDPEHYLPPLAEVVADPGCLADALGELDHLSLIDFDTVARTFSVHRLVQAAARDALKDEAWIWAASAVAAANAAFPTPEYHAWPQCRRLVPHARAAAGHATDDVGWPLARLLGSVGIYLEERAALDDVLGLQRRCQEIFDRLAKADPGNAGWQRDLSVSYNKVGDVLVAQGNLPEALKSFRDSLAIRDRLAKADPGNAGWQRDLSVSYDKIGDVLVAQGNLPEALKSFRDSLAIADRLAKADPGNAGWQRDLSVSYDKSATCWWRRAILPRR